MKQVLVVTFFDLHCLQKTLPASIALKRSRSHKAELSASPNESGQNMSACYLLSLII
jgi:hypothetical protein